MGFASVVDHHWHQKRCVVRHVQQPPRGEIPLAPEITFDSRIGVP